MRNYRSLVAAIVAHRHVRAAGPRAEQFGAVLEQRRGLHDRPARGSERIPKQKGKAPSIDVTVVGGPTLTMDKFSLSTTNKTTKVTMKPEKLRPHTDGTETIAIAIVINGQMILDRQRRDSGYDDNSKYPGVLKNLEQAIDKLNLGDAGPPGSKGVVVSYPNGAEIKVPLGDLTEHQRRRARRAEGLQEQDRYRHDVGHRDGDGRAAQSGHRAQSADRRRRR